MPQIQITISEEHYQHLRQRAHNQKISLDQFVSALIEADIIWQQKLASDPMKNLFGQIEDTFDTKDIDELTYGQLSAM